MFRHDDQSEKQDAGDVEFRRLIRPTVLLLHGLGCGGEVWDALRHKLEREGWSCMAPTLRPDARPRERPRDIGSLLHLADLVEDARAACRDATRASGQPPIIVGHSMGGLIAQVLASEGLCTCVALVAPAPCRGVANRSPWVPWLYANVLLSGRRDRHHRAWRCGIDTAMLHRLPRTKRAAVRARMRWEPGPVFADMVHGLAVDPGRVASPLLFVAGGRDRIVPHAVVYKLAAFYGAGPAPQTFLHCPDNGHWIIDEPDNAVFVDGLISWLAANASAWSEALPSSHIRRDELPQST